MTTNMKMIRMLESSSVLTKKGPVNYKKGEEVLVEGFIAASLVGRTMGEYIIEEKEVKVLSEEDLWEMTVPELRKLAQAKKVPGYNSLRKELLVEALAPNEPPPSPFESIENAVIEE